MTQTLCLLAGKERQGGGGGKGTRIQKSIIKEIYRKSMQHRKIGCMHKHNGTPETKDISKARILFFCDLLYCNFLD